MQMRKQTSGAKKEENQDPMETAAKKGLRISKLDDFGIICNFFL